MFDEIEVAPGPAAVSMNGNGADAPEPSEAPTDEMPALVWIAGAPPAAILIVAASGAMFALLFLAIAHAVKGGNVNR